MPALLDFLRQLLSDLGLQRSGRRAYRLDDELAPALKDLARREHRSEGEVMHDLLASGILRRQKDDDNLQRWKELSRREQEVVALACLDYTNQEIAERLTISPETVKAHIRHAVGKFGVRTKVQLQRALENWDFSTWDRPRQKN